MSGLTRRLVIWGVLTLGGCGLSERAYLERRAWPLLATRPTSLAPRRRGRTLLIRSLRAGPAAQARGLQTLQPDGSVQTAFYEEWAAPPAELVEAALRAWLAASGRFAAVLDPGSRAAADLVLEAELQALIAEPGAGSARAALSYVLLDDRGHADSVLRDGEARGLAALSGSAPPDEVRAMSAAVALVCAQVEAALATFA